MNLPGLHLALTALGLILGALTVDRMGLLTTPTHGSRSTHGGIHAPLSDYVTHRARTADHAERDNPSSEQSREHARHTRSGGTHGGPPLYKGGPRVPGPQPSP